MCKLLTHDYFDMWIPGLMRGFYSKAWAWWLGELPHFHDLLVGLVVKFVRGPCACCSGRARLLRGWEWGGCVGGEVGAAALRKVYQLMPVVGFGLLLAFLVLADSTLC